MTTEAPSIPAKKRISIFWWFGGIFLLLLVLFFFQLFGPNPKIVISPQTTYIIAPLRANGFPDYDQYIVDSARPGITHDNNAAALLWRAMGLGSMDVNDRSLMAAELEITDELTTDRPLQPIYSAKTREAIAAWLNQQGRLVIPGQTFDDATIQQMLHLSSQGQAAGATQLDQLIELTDTIIDQASSRPWTSKEFPPLATWVAENQAPLDLLVEASKRPRFYSPAPGLLRGESLMTALPMTSIQTYREVARSLPVRAMWHAGEGRPLEAWQDLLAVHRLGSRCAGNTLVEYLVALAITDIACDSTRTLLGDAQLSSADARQILSDLSTLQRLPSIALIVDHGERVFALDAVLEIASQGGSVGMLASGPSNPSSPYSVLNHIAIDWNIVLTEINFWFDQIVAALQTSGQVARAAAVDQVFADMTQAASKNSRSTNYALGAFSRRRRSRLIATFFADMLTPAIQSAAAAENRASTTLDLTRLMAALAVYRAEHSTYPEKLTNLVPSVLDNLPTDFYQAKPYIYHRTADGYLLYSCGENGVDDRGSNKTYDIFEGRTVQDIQKAPMPQFPDIPDGADDIAIRVPRLPIASSSSPEPATTP